jgi:mannose-6-phosphate isomerase-like protein (cupin superfamily)
MPVIRHPSELEHHREQGWTRQAWAGTAAFGQEVPMVAHRHRLAPGADSPQIPLCGQEALAYVIAGSGAARVAGEDFPLGTESMLWLAACHGLALRGGPAGLDVLVAESAAAGGPVPASLRKVFSAGELPRLVSTRDTRDRLDLVTGDVPVGATLIRADRIIYHPGDTAAAHYHTDCHHVFCVLAGSGLLYAGGPGTPRPVRLTAGDSALIGPGEVHWFENDTGEEFSFVEFWAPPPAGTVWTVAGDRCTWAPAG